MKTIRYAFIALLTLFTTFYSLAIAGRFDAAVQVVEIVASVYIVLILACIFVKKVWRD